MSYQDATDSNLSRGCRQGDAAAWRELVRRFTPLVYRIALRTVRHAADAEDVCQEAFMRMHRSIDSFDPTRPLKPWVARVAYHASLRRIEQGARRKEVQDQAAAEPAPRVTLPVTPEEHSQQREATALLEGALADLATRDQLLLTLRYREEMSDTEVAEASELPVGTVKTRIFRARAALRRALAPLLGEEAT